MKLSELKKMATENGISLKHLTGKMLKKSELAEKLMTKGVMVKSPKKSRKTSRKPKKTSRKPVKKSRKPKKTSRKPVKKSRKPVKKSRKPKKTSRPNKKQPKKVRKYMMKRPRTDDPQDGKRVKREYKLATWELITSEIERLLTIERTTGYKIKPRLNHINNPVVVGVKFVCNKEGGWWGKWGKPISVEICEMDIVLRDGVPQFKINKGTLQPLEYINSLTSVSVDERSLDDEKTITAANITNSVKTALRI